MRCFIAIRLPATDGLRQVLRALGRMGRAIRPTLPENLHVTLRFLGDVPRAEFDDLPRVMAEAVVGVASFQAQVRGLGAYPDARRPRVVWVGLEPFGRLQGLAAQLAGPLDALGFPADRRVWEPHATVARVKARPPAELGSLLAELADAEFGPVPIDRVELIVSELTPRGPIYRTAATSRLTPP